MLLIFNTKSDIVVIIKKSKIFAYRKAINAAADLTVIDVIEAIGFRSGFERIKLVDAIALLKDARNTFLDGKFVDVEDAKAHVLELVLDKAFRVRNRERLERKIKRKRDRKAGRVRAIVERVSAADNADADADADADVDADADADADANANANANGGGIVVKEEIRTTLEQEIENKKRSFIREKITIPEIVPMIEEVMLNSAMIKQDIEMLRAQNGDITILYDSWFRMLKRLVDPDENELF